MEYIIGAIIIIAAIATVIFIRKKERHVDVETKEKQVPLVVVPGKEYPQPPATRDVRANIRPTSPPPAPPMRTPGSRGFSAPYGGSSVTPAPTPVHNDGISLTDIVVGALVLDALTPDPAPEAKVPYVDAPYDYGTPSREPERLPDPMPTYREPEPTPVRDTTDYGSKSDDSGWSGSSSSSDWGSSSSRDSSSSSFD